MTPEDMDELEERVLKIIEHENVIEGHADDHDWVKLQRHKDETRIARNEAITRAVIQWSVLGILGGIAALIASWWKGNHGG